MSRVYPIGAEAAVTAYVDKEFATLCARAALCGATLHRIEDDRGCELFVITKGHITRHVVTTSEVEAWLGRFEGR